MDKTVRELLFEILTISNYTKDKEQVIADFEEMNKLETFANIFETLPLQARVHLTATQANKEVLLQYISSEEYVAELMKVTQNALLEFIAALTPVLDRDQKEKIAALVA